MHIPKLTIIVPIYNAEDYLCRCVDSILNQTFTDFELLLINDGSKDNSGEMCDKYAEKDNRIKTFHKPNGGVSSARNFGLDHARGKWVSFIDIDDWVEKDYFSTLCTVSIEADMYMCGYQPYFPVIKEAIYDNKSSIKDFLPSHIFFFSNVFSKLFRNDLIQREHIRFNECMNYAEDTYFVFCYLMNISSIATVSYAGYHYEDVGGSLSKQMHSVDKGIYIFTEFCKRTLDLEKLYGINMDENRNYVGVNLIRSMIEWLRGQNDFINTRNGLKQMCRNEYVVRYLFHNPCVVKGKKRRIFNMLSDNGMYNILTIYVLLFKGVIY